LKGTKLFPEKIVAYTFNLPPTHAVSYLISCTASVRLFIMNKKVWNHGTIFAVLKKSLSLV